MTFGREATPTYPLDSSDPTPDLVAMSSPAPRVDPPWSIPKIISSPFAVDFVQCTCGGDVWVDKYGEKREYGEGVPHFCPNEDGGQLESLHDLADALAEAQADHREAREAHDARDNDDRIDRQLSGQSDYDDTDNALKGL